jgi:putative MATE family efflux protein
VRDPHSDITEGPLGHALFRLAWPVIVAEGLYTAFHIVDVAWVGRLGASATAAVTTSTFAMWTLLGLGSLVTTGLLAHVSRAVGARDRARAADAVGTGIGVGIAIGAVVAVAGVIAAPALFRAIDAPPEVAQEGATFLRILVAGSPITFVYLAGAAVMRAAGNSRTPMLVTATCVVANATLDPLFIYGLRLGVAGAALATVLCQAGGVAAFATLARRGHPHLPVAWARVRRPDLALAASLVRVGTPSCLAIAGFSLVYLWFSHLASGLGPAALAVVGLVNRLESLCYLPADGFGAAAATIVGQNLGAKQASRAWRGAWSAIAAGASLSVALMVVYLAAPAPILGLFSGDAAVAELGVPYLRAVALCLVGVGMEGVIAGGFAGAGNTVPPLVVHLSVTALRLPLSAWLVGKLGLMGIAWTITGTTAVRSVVLAVWFARGRWLRHELDVRRAVVH